MDNMQRFGVGLVMLSLSALPVMSGCSTTISDRIVTLLTTTEASQRHGAAKALFIDARPRPAYERGHIEGAINLRLGELSYIDRDPRLTDRSPLIVYGENPGSASALALAKRLMEMKYAGVVYYKPGFAGWRSAGLPVERSGN